jgi:hypothetical protein
MDRQIFDMLFPIINGKMHYNELPETTNAKPKEIIDLLLGFFAADIIDQKETKTAINAFMKSRGPKHPGK